MEPGLVAGGGVVTTSALVPARVLLIGYAPPTMSSIGAVGITVAIQDAVVASNVLGPRLRVGRVSVADLAAVQRRREWPVRIVQADQQLVQDWMMADPGGNGIYDRPLWDLFHSIRHPGDSEVVPGGL